MAVAALMAVAGCGPRGGDQGAAPRVAGPPAPAFEVRGVSGRTVALADFRGRPVIVNFWATWCQPCRRELPSLIELQQRLASRGLEVVAISIDANPSDVEAFLKEQPLPFTIGLDPEHQTADRFGVSSVPATFILDGEGRVVERVDGEVDWGRSDLVRTLEALLGSDRSGMRQGG